MLILRSRIRFRAVWRLIHTEALFLQLNQLMMRRFIGFFLVSLSAAALLTACQKEYSTEYGNNPGNIVDCKSCSYFPWCDGSVYHYIDTTTTGVNLVTQELDVQSDTTFDSKIWQKTLVDGGYQYYNCSNGVSSITQFNALAPGAGGTVTKLVNTLLKANDGAGSTWSDVVTTSSGANLNYDYELVARGINRTVLGDTYNDVIQVHLTVSIEVPLLGSIDLTESDYYYANNVGLIENETYDALVGSPIVHRVLDSYSIP